MAALLHVTIREPVAWYFYALLLVLLGGTAWYAFEAIKAIRVTRWLGRLRRLGQEASVPASPMTTVVWMNVAGRIAMAVLCAAGMWLVIDDNFRRFRRMQVTEERVHLVYEWINRDIPRNAIQSVSLVRRHDRKRAIEVKTTDGKLYRSVTSGSDAVVSNCEDIVANLQQALMK